ncbi:hypothetical protein SOVF_124540 [Spinacia oleracea]|nr:hypothetical protein SOVF_124540 [Spinacia oleracea]
MVKSPDCCERRGKNRAAQRVASGAASCEWRSELRTAQRAASERRDEWRVMSGDRRATTGDQRPANYQRRPENGEIRRTLVVESGQSEKEREKDGN